tara:strand:- start:1224 stop:1610 length:387 start_codon:yes stop_codon:yes gene_type:complete
MKIVGIGIDIIQNERIRILARNQKFISRTFTNNEIVNSKKIKNKISYLAKRFAAKEAFAKAIGTGFRNKLNFKDIEITNNKEGQPFFTKSKKINEIIMKRFNIKKYDLFLSISDEKDYSIALTILQVK